MLSQIAGGPSSNDTALLEASRTANEAGLCSDASLTDRWWNGSTGAGGPCLSYQHTNLLRVRRSEKQVLEQLIRLVKRVDEFVADAPQSIEAAFQWLDRLLFTPDQLAAFAARDITPPYFHLGFFNEHLLPLYITQNRWDQSDDGSVDSTVSIALQLKYRALYAPETPYQLAEHDRLFTEFGYSDK